MPDSTSSVEVVPPAQENLPSPPPRPPSGASSRASPAVVLIIAVAAIVLISAVFVAGFGRGSTGGSSPSATGSTFSAARSVADRFAAAHGQWTLIEGIGVALANASYLPYNGTAINATCAPTTLAGTVPTNLSLPAFHGSLTSGEAPIWLFAYTVLGVGGELAIFELGGQVALAVELPTSCDTGLKAFQGITTPIVDSSTAVAAAAAAGGAAFLRAHPVGVSLTMDVIGGFASDNVSVFAPEWVVSWTTCSNSIFSSNVSTSGYQFFAAVNATTGSVVPGSVSNSTCGVSVAPPPEGIGGAITLGPPSLTVGPGTGATIESQGCNSGDNCFVVPIVFASENVTPADFELSVENYSSETTLESTEGFAIVNATGTVLVYSTGFIETQWTPAAGNAQTLLAAGMSIEVDVGPVLPSSSLGLELIGEGPFANSGLGISL